MNKTQREALKLLRAVAPRKATIPILTHAMIDANGARVTDLGVTDLEISAEVSAEALGVTVEGAGALSVADLRIAIERGATWLRFSENRCAWAGDGLGEFVTLPAADFPARLAGDAHGAGVRAADGLPAALAMVAPAMTADNARYSLNGAALTPKGMVVATDGHRLHLALGGVTDLDKETWSVPANAVKILAGWKGALTVERFGDALRFAGGPGVLWARRLEGRFPNWEKVFPTETPHRWTVGAEAFMRATEAIYKFSDRRTHCVEAIANGSLGLTARLAEGGEMIVSVALAEPLAAPVRFGMNLGYLRDAVGALGGEVRCGLGAGRTDNGTYLPGPLHLTGERGEAVIMPTRI